jgi:hypothetical protein
MTPTPNGRYVPMDLYLEDRREIKESLADIAADVKAMRRELDRDDGREVAEEAATAAVQQTRRTRSEFVRDVGLCVFSAALAVGGTVVTTAIT